ncbi:hypothetical protein chiPu_0004463 [Chiloscyllium punctatum]|uniref:Uncharacterized protein n=1 Tax=Chiloscyllium punctatum TaxID=137246 RepID=A0A401S6M7_CHIPU|nr:hypothetical protein [Chiloscyllium punctatum]
MGYPAISLSSIGAAAMCENDATNFAYFHASIVAGTRTAAAECKGDKLEIKVAFCGDAGTYTVTLGVGGQDMQILPTCQQGDSFCDIEGEGASENGARGLAGGAGLGLADRALGAERGPAGLPHPEHRRHPGQEPRQPRLSGRVDPGGRPCLPHRCQRGECGGEPDRPEEYHHPRV